MSWQRAPVYTRTHALCRFVGELGVQRAQDGPQTLLRELDARSRELLCAVSLALTFPRIRPLSLHRADEQVVCLRVQARLARDLRVVSPGWVRAMLAQLDEIGRMLGGWQRSLAEAARQHAPGHHELQGPRIVPACEDSSVPP